MAPISRITAIAMNGPAPPPPGVRPPRSAGGMDSRSPGNVAATMDGLAVGGPTDPDGMGWGWPTCPVGSNSTQPVFGKYTSTHQCADDAGTASTLSGPGSLGRKP